MSMFSDTGMSDGDIQSAIRAGVPSYAVGGKRDIAVVYPSRITAHWADISAWKASM